MTLACLREDIDQQPHQFKSILMDDKLRKTFFPDLKADQKKVVAAFCKMSAENALKKKPKVHTLLTQDALSGADDLRITLRIMWTSSCSS